MDLAHAKQVAFAAARLTMPRFTYSTENGHIPDPPQYKVIKLEEFMLETSIVRSDLEDAKLWVAEMQHKLVIDWEKLVGWETNLPGGKKLKDATQADIATAKRHARPDLWEAISDCKHVASLLSGQVRRLERDDDVASRAYTFIMGSG